MKERPLQITVGTDSFKKLVTTGDVFVDKTLFIKEIIDSGMEAILITRPRRWGKTLGLDMLKTFFGIETDATGNKVATNSNKALFAGGEIKVISTKTGDEETIVLPPSKLAQSDDGKLLAPQGKYPVIFVNFKDAYADSFDEVKAKIISAIQTTFQKHRYLARSDKLAPDQIDRCTRHIAGTFSDVELADSLRFLSELLYEHHGKKNKVYILVDEYDKPVNHFLEKGLTSDIEARTAVAKLITSIMSACGKGNDALEKIIITGILDAFQKESGSGFNNVLVFGVLDARFGNSFGFSTDEVDSLVSKLGFDAAGADRVKQDIRGWYNGYAIPVSATEWIQAHTPWPVMAHLAEVYDGKTFEPQSYWVRSGVDKMLDNLSSTISSDLLDKLKRISDGKEVSLALPRSCNIFAHLQSESASEEVIAYLLLSRGYITKKDELFVMPNKEVAEYFKEKVIKAWLEKEMKIDTLSCGNSILKQVSASLSDSVEFKKKVQELILDKVGAGDKAENYFQSLVGGIIELYAIHDGDGATHNVLSEKTTGFGRIDNIFYPRELKGIASSNDVIIHEYKKLSRTALGEKDRALDEALYQIIEKGYLAEPLSKKEAHPHHKWALIKIRSIVFVQDDSNGKWSVDLVEKELAVEQAQMVARFFSDELVRTELGLHQKTRKPEESRNKFLSILNKARERLGESKFDHLAALLDVPAAAYDGLLKTIMQHKVESVLKDTAPARVDAVLDRIIGGTMLEASAISAHIQTEFSEKIDPAAIKLLLDCEKSRTALSAMPPASAGDSPLSSVGAAASPVGFREIVAVAAAAGSPCPPRDVIVGGSAGAALADHKRHQEEQGGDKDPKRSRPSAEDAGAGPGHGIDSAKPASGFWAQYYPAGLERLLELRLAGTKTKVHEVVECDGRQASTEFEQPSWVPDHALLSIGSEPTVVPVLYRAQGKKPAHWVGLVVIKADEACMVIYIDPENKPMPQVLIKGMLNRLPTGVIVNFVQKLVTEQSCSDNCGPELIEGLAEIITGARISEAEAVAFHSALYEAHLLDQAPVVGEVQHVTTRLMLNTPNGSTKPFDFSCDVTTGEIIDAREVSTEAPSSASPSTEQPTPTSQPIPTLHLDGGGTIVSDFISFMQATAQHGATLLWNLAPLLETAQTLLNKALDSKNIIMTLMLLDTVDALHSQDPFAHAGFPGRYPGGDPDDSYGGGNGDVGAGGNGDGGANLPSGPAAFGPTPTSSGQSANASSGSGVNSSHALNFTGSEGDVDYAGHVANNSSSGTEM